MPIKYLVIYHKGRTLEAWISTGISFYDVLSWDEVVIAVVIISSITSKLLTHGVSLKESSFEVIDEMLTTAVTLRPFKGLS